VATDGSERTTAEKRQDRKAEKRQAILRGAVRVFAEKGFFNARVSEIAGAAGVADGTIYLYFKNKDDILITIFEEKMSWFIEECQARIAPLSNPLEKLAELIRFQMFLFDQSPEMAEVITVELRQSSKFMREYRPQQFLDYLNLYTQCIREAQGQGLIAPEVSPKIISRAIFGAMDEISLAWALSGRRQYTLKEGAEQVVRMFLHGIGAQPKAGEAVTAAASAKPTATA